MCWVCEHPEATRQERLDYLRGVLDQRAWVAIGVHEERYRPPYSYTLGLTDRELPEVVITGLPHEQAADVLTWAVLELVGGGTLAPGRRIRPGDGLLAEVVKVAEPGAHLDVAADLYGPELTAVQLVYTDERGRWPWDKRFRDGRGGQPVLGVRAKQAALHGASSVLAGRSHRTF